MPQPNTLRIEFTPNYTGNHRVCWRQGIVGPYDCSTIVAGVTGVPQTVDIPFDYTPINLTCESDVLNGYVQPTCVPESCPYLQTPFTVGYTPYCRLWRIECDSVSIDSIQVTNIGSGYTPGAVIPVIFFGGGGSGAAANAHISNGAVSLPNGGAGPDAGTGYTDGTFYNVPTAPAGPNPVTGTGLVFAEVVISGGSLSSYVFNAQSADGGSGYIDTQTFTLVIPGNPGNGDIQLGIEEVVSGTITWVELTSPGISFTGVPSVSIGGTGTLLAVLGNCPDYDMGSDCSGSLIGVQPARPLGWKYKKCEAIGPGNPVSTDGWIATLGALPDNCCYACEEVTFFNGTGSLQEIMYVDYVTRAWSTSGLADGDDFTVQIVKGTGWMTDNTPSGGSPVSGSPCAIG